MRVYVCDNEKDALEYLVTMLESCEGIEIAGQFMRQADLMDSTDKLRNIDIIFMDIDWKQELNGIQLSRQIYDISPDTQIIYVTGYNDRFSQQIFLEDANLCGYLVKPVDERLLEQMIDRAKKRLTKNREKLIINLRGQVRSVLFKDIYYLESQGHNVIIHTQQETMQVYDKLDQYIDKLSRAFLQCHKSYVVNMDYIEYIDKNVILLKDGTRVTISKSRYREFRNAYFRYVGSEA